MSRSKTFKGGIHPEYNKDSTKALPIVDIPGSEEMVFPLIQHIGAQAVPEVEVGERVFVGQRIAKAGGFVSAHIHSSVSGTVKSIEPRLHPSGVMVDSIVVENDFQDEIHPDICPKDWKSLSPKEIIDAVCEAGMVGMGGAAFPSHIKLSPPADKKIEYVIVNGAECEPYLTSDHRAMLETSEDIIEGLKIVMKIFDLKTGYIAIEDNKPDAIKKMAEAAGKETEVEIKVVSLRTKYPQGSEKHLIKAVTNRTVPSGKLPMDVGVIVDNIDTCASIARVFSKGLPLISRIVTVNGDCIENPANFRVKVGTNIGDVIAKSGNLKKDAKKIVMGGPMMGTALQSADIPVIKGSSGILVFGEDAVSLKPVTNCLRCGKCIDACAMNLMPNVIKRAVATEDLEKAKELGIMDCMQCGSCAYVCPAGQNPLQTIRTGRVKIAKENANKEGKKNG